MESLHIDIETYSSVDLAKAGMYKYMESFDFEILLFAYAFNDDPVTVIDLAQGESLPFQVLKALRDDKVIKKAHNAAFERHALKLFGYDIPSYQWQCSMVKSAYCGLPLSLDGVSVALKLEEKGKMDTGKPLIRYFCQPCKPSKVNGGRTRNLPVHDLEKWEAFKEYNKRDVISEREVDHLLSGYPLPDFEQALYVLDQRINDYGIRVDTDFAQAALDIDAKNSHAIKQELEDLTGLENPNSPAQLKQWLSDAIEEDVATLAKDSIDPLIDKCGPGLISDVLELRKKASKTSIKKYDAMIASTCSNGRAHGLFQFYGANRTGRWAGRIIQLHNLPQNHIGNLQLARDIISQGDYDLACIFYEQVSSVLSQLIRTAFVPDAGNLFVVADFSAIEARVISWLADETWRLKVFRTHGRIYEASAALMFGVPIESVTKGSDMRAKGKVAELALGYQGSVGAMVKMGAENIGLSEKEMRIMVNKWRRTNSKIVELWGDIEENAIRAIKTKKATKSVHKNLIFDCDDQVLTIQLPSGRKLFYQSPTLGTKYGKPAIKYKGTNQETKQWGWVDTYGGKLVENIVQAIARDVLAVAMDRIGNKNGYDIVMHVHDEIVVEVPKFRAEENLEEICAIMGKSVDWAPGLPLAADGYVTPFYKKD